VQFNNGPAYNDGNVDISANGLTLVWFGAQYSDLVFTAPATGVYSLTGVFLGAQNNVGSVVAVVANGSVVFNSTVTSEGQTVPFNATVNLTAGNTVVFSAGPGGGNQNTGLSANVTGPLGIPPAVNSVVSDASFTGGGSISSGSWVAVFGLAWHPRETRGRGYGNGNCQWQISYEPGRHVGHRERQTGGRGIHFTFAG
jgi:hypothetical protein